MTRKISVLLVVLIISMLCGCSTNKIYEIEVFSDYNLNKVLELSDGERFTVSNDNINITELGTYEVSGKIEYPNKKTKEVTYTIAVVDTQSPQLIVDDVIVISTGDLFNPIDHIDVSDNYDTNKNNMIKVVENTVDSKTEGTYSVRYAATDSSGNNTNKVVKVVVADKKYTLVKNAIKVLFNSLKFPESLLVQKVMYNDYADSIADYDVVVIEYSAKNSFGESIPDRAYLDVYQDGKVETNPIGDLVGINGEELDQNIILSIVEQIK